MKRRRAISMETGLLMLACGLATGTLAFRIVRAAPLSLRLPPTIFTNAHPASRPVSPYVIFLAAVREIVPAGAVVRVVAPRQPTGDISMNFLIAVGQLPEQRVHWEGAPPEPREWIAVYPSGALPGTPIRRLPGGDLYHP